MDKIARKGISIFLIVLIIFSLIPLQVCAAEVENENEGKVLIIFTPNIDPRLYASGKAIFMEFINLETGEIVPCNFYKENDYSAKIYLNKGEWAMASYQVSGDFTFKYTINDFSFFAVGNTVKISFDVGDINNTEQAEEEDNIPGTIDRDKTDELLQEDGKNPVDWDKIDKDREPSSTTPETTFPIIIPDTTEPSVPDETEPTVPDTTIPDVSEPDGTVPEETEPSDNDEKNGNKTAAIIYVIIIVLIVVAVYVYRYRNNFFLSRDDEE